MPTPYYLPCDFAQVYEFYAAVTHTFPEASTFVYLFPERSGIDVSPEELAQLTAIDESGCSWRGRNPLGCLLRLSRAVRPVDPLSCDKGRSPSDHAAMAGAVAAGLLLVSWGLGLVTTACALVMAADRVYVGVHYPQDVVAGLGDGLAGSYGSR